uniref:Uncharacterized protein n=1 Tax=Rhizophora mucronata TaxID=61149 RepID=A0A2P2QV77_RHIMU
MSISFSFEVNDNPRCFRFFQMISGLPFPPQDSITKQFKYTKLKSKNCHHI